MNVFERSQGKRQFVPNRLTEKSAMLSLDPRIHVITFFEGATKSMSPVIRQIILEDVANLLEGRGGDFVMHRDDLRKDFLQVCEQCGVHLSQIFWAQVEA
ncbi:MAG: hypothetical protein JO019_03540 [Candidatus Kaiserbacteria bacterium]|nr:hypothetical protein [Candidatus Kaiserbacteria bacterium]